MSKKLHMICGMCGSSEHLKFEIKLEEDEYCDDVIEIYIICENCSTLTSLDEHIEERKN